MSNFDSAVGRLFKRRGQLAVLTSLLLILLFSFDWLDSRQALLSHGRMRRLTSTQHVKFYIYELPDEMSKDVWSKPIKAQWLAETSEYDGDAWVYHSLANSPYRTYNPEEASLFYIPVFPTRYKHQIVNDYSWDDVHRRASLQVRDAVQLVSTQHPFWNRTNGADHFLSITGDEGRCEAFRKLNANDFGDLFVVQHHGDLAAFNQIVPRPHSGLPDVAQEDAWPCYRPDRDIVIPTYLPEDEVPSYPVHAAIERNRTVLYSFDALGFAAQVPFRNVRVRKELRKYFEAEPPVGSEWPREKSVKETIEDMAHSVFCVTPPGLVAHTSRLYRAIRRGCIPIHFMSAYDLPFESVLDYDSFSLRLHPHNVRELNNQVANLLSDKRRLEQMQKNLQRIQDQLTWERTPGKLSGVDKLLLGELDRAADRVQRMRKASPALASNGTL